MEHLLSPRWFAGISISAMCRRIESAVIGIHGQGSGAPVEIRKTISFDIPREITASFNELQGIIHGAAETNGNSTAHNGIAVPASLYHHVLRELASIEEEAVTELLHEARLTVSDILAVGVNDAGIRSLTPAGRFYLGLCDAPYLAQQTGLNIVDHFPAADIAAQGNGGPLLPLPAWIFLKSDNRSRLLLDLGRTARMTFLPKAENAFSYQKITHLDITPCGSLLDALIWQLTDGKTAADAGGRFAVQGQQVPALLTQLRNALEAKSDWIPQGVVPDRYLQIAAAAAQNGHPHQDILCTVCTFLAERIVSHLGIQMNVSVSSSDNEILLTGGCRQHGLLMNVLSSQLGYRTLTPISQIGVPMDTFDSLCTAMLTLLTVEHIPGNLPQLTGCDSTKTLGRITPGTIRNWHRLLCEMAAIKPADRTLRSAA
ncbi:MAG: anhydro-N-acetylmuramic acid kinase [Planctomycetaceae bacterium]|jgi:anhydro-N-acetylmuramic acid kinase|nr:anhydro-N-acetylmuramic acid kinase [Planctomycetaceae bacterium]